MSAKLALGTVQFGLNYGVSNAHGCVSQSEVLDILNTAKMGGIRVLDTAALYGNSEEVLGRSGLSCFDVVTKTPRFAAKQILSEHVNTLIETFKQSCVKLQQNTLHGLLVHHVDDILAPGGQQLWRAMLQLREAGLVRRIGASVYESSQIDELLMRFNPDLIQLPINVLDQRLLKGGHLEKLKERGVEVHARSAFLQGLLLMNPPDTHAYFEPIRQLLERFKVAANDQGMTPLQASLAFVRDIAGIDQVVIGVTKSTELKQCIEDFENTSNFSGEGLACDMPAYINPALWRIS